MNRIRTNICALCVTTFVFAFAMFLAPKAQAEHELTAGFGNFSGGAPGAAIDVGSGSSLIQLTGGFFTELSDLVQLGGEFGLTVVTGGGSTVLTLLPGARFNFGKSNDIKEQFYIEPLVGITHVSSGADSTNFTFQIGVGKRWEIFDSVSLSPSLGIYKVGSSSVRFFLKPVEFSIFF